LKVFEHGGGKWQLVGNFDNSAVKLKQGEEGERSAGEERKGEKKKRTLEKKE